MALWLQLASCIPGKLRIRMRDSTFWQLVTNGVPESELSLQTPVADALAFLDHRPSDIALPHPDQGADGEFGIYWDNRKAQVFAEVTFAGDGTYSYFAVHGEPDDIIDECGRDDVELSGPWPKDLLGILRIQAPV